MMGQAKNEMMRHDELVQVATHQCMEIGAIEECQVHSGTYIDSLEYSDPKELAEAILEDDPQAIDQYKDLEEMTDCVQGALESAGTECGSCGKYMDS